MTAILTAAFIAVALLGRFIEHAPNFTPVGALALWSGMFLPRRYSVGVPLAVMFASDFSIGLYDPVVMIAVYSSLAITTALGWVLRRRYDVGRVALASVSGSLLFFVVTNFAVWARSDWYQPTLEGLKLCYTLAIPFFRNSLMGDLTFGAFFFGLTAAAPYLDRKSVV